MCETTNPGQTNTPPSLKSEATVKSPTSPGPHFQSLCLQVVRHNVLTQPFRVQQRQPTSPSLLPAATTTPASGLCVSCTKTSLAKEVAGSRLSGRHRQAELGFWQISPGTSHKETAHRFSVYVCEREHVAILCKMCTVSTLQGCLLQPESQYFRLNFLLPIAFRSFSSFLPPSLSFSFFPTLYFFCLFVLLLFCLFIGS